MNNNKVHSLNVLFFFAPCITYKVLKSIIIVRRISITMLTVFEFSRVCTRKKIIFFYENYAFKYFKNHFGRRSRVAIPYQRDTYLIKHS